MKTEGPPVIPMIEMKHIRVTERIADLQRETDRLHAERVRHIATARPHAPRAAGSPLRLRLGRWLVGVGEAIAGPSSSDDDATSMPHAA